VNTGGTSAGAISGSTAAGVDGLRGEDFMKILMKQLQYQDPFKPMDNGEMIDQIAKIRELEMNTRLSDKLAGLGDQERFAAAAAMIGKYVRGQVQDADGNTFEKEGVVSGVRFNASGEAMLELDTGDLLPLTALTQLANTKADMKDAA
jgi:flagellar basal-body rod modification protein FlgD